METERPSPRYSRIDLWEPSEILEAMIEGQFSAVAAVRAARPAIERAAVAIVRRQCGDRRNPEKLGELAQEPVGIHEAES